MFIRVLSKKESRQNERELLAYCKENHSAMYGFMRLITGQMYVAKYEERDRILSFVRRTKYLSKKKLIDFILEPVRIEISKSRYVVGKKVKK
jgi:hypothetical protein